MSWLKQHIQHSNCQIRLGKQQKDAFRKATLSKERNVHNKTIASLRSNAESLGLSIMSRDLPHNTCGLYDDRHRLMLLADWLNPRQEYCTLVHELIHAHHRDPGCGTPYGVKCERLRLPVGVVGGHVEAGVAHDCGAGVVGHAGLCGHGRGPMAGAVDPDLWQSGRLQGLAPMVGFGGFAYRIAPLVREDQLTRADMKPLDARHRRVHRLSPIGTNRFAAWVLGVVSHRMPYRWLALSQFGMTALSGRP